MMSVNALHTLKIMVEWGLLPDLLGWVANIFLIFQLFSLRKRSKKITRWVLFFGVGWIVFGLGFLLLFSDGNLHDLRGFILTFLSPLFWIAAWFMFRSERNRAPVLIGIPEPDVPQESVWPPPPTKPPS